MVTQAVKKGVGIHRKGLSALKDKMGLNINRPSGDEVVKVDDLIMSSANKPQKWILMPESFRQVTKLPGIPMNTCVMIKGHSNVGKTTLINHALASAQQQDLIPVIFDTENNFSFEYARAMGFQAEPVYGNVEVEDVDMETGEITGKHVERKIIDWEGNFLYFNSRKLYEMYKYYDYSQNKTVSKARASKVAVVEDVAKTIDDLLDAQDNGEIEQGFLFCWDSVGSVGCYKELGGSHNNMFVAGAISQAFTNIMNSRIPGSKGIGCKYDNTFLIINKVWLNNTTNPVGPPSLEAKGGKSITYAVRLEILMGGQLSAGIKRLTATSKGFNYGYGIQTKIKILKNHLDAPHNVTYEGSIIATDTGFIGVEDLENYKKQNVARILKRLNEEAEGKCNIKETEISFEEADEMETE